MDDRKLYFFDFDKTITNCDSFMLFIKFLLSRSLVRRLLVIILLPVLFVLYHVISKKRAISLLFWVASFGLTIKNYRDALEEFSSGIVARKPFIYSSAYELVSSLMNTGSKVVVLSATPTELVRTIVNKVFSAEVVVHGSTTEKFLGGFVLSERMYGKAKLEFANCHYGNSAQWEEGYSDDLSDMPMLKRCIKINLINFSADQRHSVSSHEDANIVNFHEWKQLKLFNI